MESSTPYGNSPGIVCPEVEYQEAEIGHRRSWRDYPRYLSLVTLLLSPVVYDDLAVTHTLGLTFVGLCCWRD